MYNIQKPHGTSVRFFCFIALPRKPFIQINATVIQANAKLLSNTLLSLSKNLSRRKAQAKAYLHLASYYLVFTIKQTLIPKYWYC